MNKRASYFVLLLVLLAGTALCLPKIPHTFTETECSICHSTDEPGTKVTGDVTGKCMTCHTNLYDKGYMHPVGVEPNKAEVPADMPLADDGTITCITCHDPHTEYKTPFGRKSGFLRRLEKGRAFCNICHANGFTANGGHHEVFRNAHFKQRNALSSQALHIDDLSRECISCHDGSMASSVDLRAGDWQHSNDFMKFDKGGKHPIGMSYEGARNKSKRSMLRPRSLVDKRIHFFNKGCIGCGSCHDPYSVKSKKLVIEIKGSALCFGCHMNGQR